MKLTKDIVVALAMVDYRTLSLIDGLPCTSAELYALGEMNFNLCLGEPYHIPKTKKRSTVKPKSLMEAWSCWRNWTCLFQLFYGDHIADYMMVTMSWLGNAVDYSLTPEEVAEILVLVWL